MAELNILSLSLKDIKEQIDSLKASLVGLDKESAEYRLGVAEVVKQQTALDQVLRDTKGTVQAAEGSYAALSQQMAKMKAEWRSTGDEARRAQLGAQISEVNAKLKEMDASIGNYQRNVGNYEIATKSLRTELSEGREQLARLIQQYGLGDSRVQALSQSLNGMRDALDDANAMIKQGASDTEKLDTAMDVFKTGTAFVGLFQGALAQMGVEEGKSVQVIQKLQGSMLMLQSLTQIQTALTDRSSKTYRLLSSVLTKLGLVKKADAVATQTQTKAENQLTAAEIKETGAAKLETTATQGLTAAKGGATIATRLFGNALKALPFVGIIAVIGSLIASLMDLSDWFGSSSKSSDELNESVLATASAADIASLSYRKLIEVLRQKGYLEEHTTKFNEAYAENTKVMAKYEELLHDITVMEQGNFSQVIDKSNKSLNERREEFSKINAEIQKNEAIMQKEQTIITNLTDMIDKNTSATTQNNKATTTNTTVTVEQNEALKESYNVLQKQLEALREEQGLRAWLMDWQYRLDKARNNTNYLSELKKQNEELNQQLEIYHTEKKALDAYIAAQKEVAKNATNEEDTKLATANIAKAEADAKKIAIAETKVKKEIELNEFNKILKEESFVRENVNRMNEDYAKRSLDNMVSMMEQGLKGIIPVVDLFMTDGEHSIDKYLATTLGQFADQMGNYSLAQSFWDKYFLLNEQDKFNTIAKQVDEMDNSIMMSFANKYNAYGFIPMDSEVATIAAINKKKLDEEKKYRDELKGLTVDKESELSEIEIELARRRFEEEARLQQEKISGLEADLNAIREMGGSTDSPDYLAKQQELIAAQEELTQSYTDYYIEQSERRMKKDQEEAKEKKATMKAWAQATFDFSNSFGKLMGAVADIKEQNLKQDYENGKISQERYEEEFERVQKIRIAELWMTTIAGAAGSFLQDMANYPFPANAIIAAADFATAMAMGIVQTRQLKQQKPDGSTSGGGGSESVGISSVGVSPLLNESLDPMLATNLETSMNSYQDKETRVYVLESDIQSANKLVEIRQSETTF